MDERRLEERHEVNVEFAELDGQMTEYVANLSRGGIFLRCDVALPIGTRVKLKFTVLVDDLETIEGVGEVVHHKSDGVSGLGIRFIKLSEQSRDLVFKICGS
jgi:uncharacterized protein (TIGR02266 family)